MKTERKGRFGKYIASAYVRAVLSLALMGMGFSNVRAAIMWNWVSVGEGNTFSGTLTTDGDYAMTLPGAGDVSFTVLSFDSWFLNGTDLVSEGPFAFNDWQMEAAPDFGGAEQYNVINWSRSDQKIRAGDGIDSLISRGRLYTFPGTESEGPLGSAVLAIGTPETSFGDTKNQIGQSSNGGGEFAMGFIPTSTVFTPVPEPRIYVRFAMIGLSVLVCIRRVRALEQELPSERSG